jgi:hypothetical protein
MNIGISFVGVSFGEGRNYKHCFSNLESYLINPFKQHHNVNTFITSYNSEFNDDIISLFNPTKHQFNDFGNSHQVLTYIKSLEQLRGQDLDFVISTRFDIHYHKDLSLIGLDFNKFNALFKENGWWDSMHFTTDNFFAFPYSMLEVFIDVLKDLYQNPSRGSLMDLHQAFYRIQVKVGIENTHIISNIDELSNTNSFYSLCNEKWGIR